MTVTIRRNDSGLWEVATGPGDADLVVTGFSTEAAASHWFAEYFALAVRASGSERDQLMRAALIAADPRGKTQ